MPRSAGLAAAPPRCAGNRLVSYPRRARTAPRPGGEKPLRASGPAEKNQPAAALPAADCACEDRKISLSLAARSPLSAGADDRSLAALALREAPPRKSRDHATCSEVRGLSGSRLRPCPRPIDARWG